ncbi:helix-turn-helix domain-containing protein [Flavobacterium sp. GSP27]|uniref:Helix-turn-helix domain-containing protein n=1 Tax=Flavobacterium bomense TaxID=2497483 RepID=A0A3S0PVS1_9FLAO|nr:MULTISPECIES: Fic family protein [Flavobacterium]RTY94547.1 helix-turn-helix domain-containing protein [Flavobacterium sp. GSN2]RTY66714.1 helix-turn-helix domain-containing protein [Flavobacterium sp. LB2P53]RTY73147.1 helix-turn-helix domain-containing protein [Flavobacterium sp. LS1R10]RTY82494.1 helix-turn-helix domain-containing protein [Flavobacterium sp. LS1P28]RTY84899.1 helix-turn-helix domain-containing protein [Flavobacterium sp. ZB4P23]
MKTLLKNAREQKGLKTREVAQLLAIDQALISKFESGTRKPTRDQVVKLASLLEIDLETIMVAWLKEKILYEIGQDEFALKALLVAEQEIRYQSKPIKKKLSVTLQKILDEIDTLKIQLDGFRQFDSYRIAQALELEYTFESNRIEGNTMTLRETDLVINEGLTISGKSMREHLEVINHQEAIAYIKDLMQKNTAIKEREVLSIHNLILRGIQPEDAGSYRKVQVMIQGSSYVPPQPFLVAKAMEDFFIWYETNKSTLHPIILAAEMHERLVTIHPFIDGNGRTSRLVMNLVLLQHGYIIANIKGDYESRMRYYQTLETAQTKNNKEDFLLFIAQIEKESLERYLTIIGQ